MSQPPPAGPPLGRIRILDVSGEREGLDPSLRPVARVPYDPARHREWVRTLLVLILTLSTVAGVLAVAGNVLFGGMQVDDALKAIGLLSPLVGLAGTALGFYFRS